ncbi:MAG: hypothetical protein J0L75_03140 [Spirochaetes bacterium]|nr:hypothetical protein [Spirochaetota bacterium]
MNRTGASLIALLSGLSPTLLPAQVPARDLTIVMAGDSTTWGNGLLDENSFVAVLDHELKNRLARTVLPDGMRFFDAGGKPVTPGVFTNPLQYLGRSAVLEGLGASVEFDLEGDSLALCHTLRRGERWAELEVSADGARLGAFTNRNPTLGRGEASFVADGKSVLFDLDRCFTYGHAVTLDGRELRGGLNTGSYMSKPPFSYFPGYEYLVIRKYGSNGQVVHALFFPAPPPAGSRLEARYRFGRVVAHTASTVGGLEDESRLESPYGNSSVSFDPARPSFLSSGLDFRRIDAGAFFVHRFPGSAKRRIRVTIRGGQDPYLAVNFASSRFHQLVNAGIGGWTAPLFLNDTGRRSWKHALEGARPDVLFLALAPNDDWIEGKRFVERRLTGLTEAALRRLPSLDLSSAKLEADGTFTAVKKAGLIRALTPTTLDSSQLAGAQGILPGYFVRIGTVTGDRRFTAVREIESFDPASGRLAWKKPLAVSEFAGRRRLEDLAGEEFSVRSLSNYQENITKLVDLFRGASPGTKLVLMNLCYANAGLRDLWGYPEALARVAAARSGVSVFDTAPALMAAEDAAISGKRPENACELEATGASEYALPWTGYHQGFRVLVDGVDLYGKSAAIFGGWHYCVTPGKTGKDLEFTTSGYHRPGEVKDPMRLVFFHSPPPVGARLRIERADAQWSGDYCHPNSFGCEQVGRACAGKLLELLGP